ncbi:hypothetical protein SPWS13_3812 [Shewanella putrefaciens]|nr:hypothetical protein SPWS13_3812 [Shewanella putrefaciens]
MQNRANSAKVNPEFADRQDWLITEVNYVNFIKHSSNHT